MAEGSQEKQIQKAMTQPIHLIAETYAVNMPEGAKYYRIDGVPNGELCELIFYKDGNDIDFPEEIEEVKIIDLPPGNWQLICTTKECTEGQAKGIVKELPVGQRWMNYNGDYPVWWHTAKESLRSLLTSKGLDPENKNYVLIKKVS